MVMPARYGLLGYPVADSPSPAMHRAAFAARGIAATYEAMPTTADEFDTRWQTLTNDGYHGANITTPLKRPAAARVSCCPLAARAQAVNTVVAREGVWQGTLTDVEGVELPLRRRGISGGRALIIGAGGAARAAVLACERLGQQLAVLVRNRVQGEQLIADLHPTAGATLWVWGDQDLDGAWRSIDVVIQATPVGRQGERFDLPWRELPARAIAFDMVYGPANTPFLADARSRGLAVIAGWEMLLAQGAAAFTFWTGEDAPVEIMRTTLLDTLGISSATAAASL